MANTALPFRLESPRLILRPPRLGDVPAISRLVDDPGVARMTTGIPHPYPQDAAGAWVEQKSVGPGDGEAVFALETAGDGFVGVLGFEPAPLGAVEIGYWLGRPFWGRGLMTEAVRAAVAWAGGVWGKRWVRAGHFADNPASGQVLIKAGFLYTGEVAPRFSVGRGEAAPTRMMVWLA
jgi:RimJ/RimL family protein N-acetyltransferase